MKFRALPEEQRHVAASWPFLRGTDGCAGGEVAQDGGKKAGVGFSL